MTVMAIATLPPPPRRTANPAPERPANSVRRTSSIDVTWPEGEEGDLLFIGQARDYRTPSGGGSGTTIAAAEYRARVAPDKTITAISATPAPARLDELVGMRGGNHLRLFLREVMPELIAEGAPLYLPLDDISGTVLVSSYAWSQWGDDWIGRMRRNPEELERMMAQRTNVCWGLQEGNSGLVMKPGENIARIDGGQLRNPADPLGWHDFPDGEGPSFRRARRIDVTLGENGTIRIDAMFQDSAKRQDGGRSAIHEYRIAATADAATLELLTLEPEARILPFSECPGAIHNSRRLIGSRLSDLRGAVPAQLPGPEGCTHLNDALRSLAETPILAAYLETQPA